jgi:hypothetical protein
LLAVQTLLTSLDPIYSLLAGTELGNDKVLGTSLELVQVNLWLLIVNGLLNFFFIRYRVLLHLRSSSPYYKGLFYEGKTFFKGRSALCFQRMVNLSLCTEQIPETVIALYIANKSIKEGGSLPPLAILSLFASIVGAVTFSALARRTEQGQSEKAFQAEADHNMYELSEQMDVVSKVLLPCIRCSSPPAAPPEGMQAKAGTHLSRVTQKKMVV